MGPLRVMDFSDANADARQGVALLGRYASHLAHHPATARRIATRLGRRFVADTPPAPLVDRLARAYLYNDTAIAPVLRALFASPEFAASVGQKWRRPQEAVTGMLRAMRPDDFVPKGDPLTNFWVGLGSLNWLLDLTDHRPRMWPYVDGYPDVADRWVNTNVRVEMNFASRNRRQAG